MSSKKAMKQAQKQSYAKHRSNITNSRLDYKKKFLIKNKDEKKNKDYGDAFATYGTIGVIVRIGDKINRLININENNINLVDDEKMEDTLLDLHNYAALALILLTEKK